MSVAGGVVAGYTPVFDSVFHGTLCGKWPTLPVWLTILPMADKNGHIDMTFQAMSALTGWPIDLLRQAITELCAPDPESRSDAEEGRRLVPIDPSRSWGWRVVNHGKYREKARKATFDAARVEDGRNAERLRARRSATRDDPTRPDATRADPPSNTNTNTNEEKTPTARSAPREAGKPKPVPRETSDPDWFLDFKLAYPERAGDQGWRKALRAANARFAEGHTPAEMIAGAHRYREFCRAKGDIRSEFVKQAATFLGPDKPFLLPWRPPPKPETAMDRLQRMTGATTDDRVIEHGQDFGKLLSVG